MMKLIFFGSGKFAAGILRCLLERKFIPHLVVTTPPAPAGRGLRLSSSAVDKISSVAQIETERPLKLKDKTFLKTFYRIKPDLFLVVDYGRILPSDLLAIPYIMPLGIHPSLLPSYRGPAPINWVLINGERKTGITFFKVNEETDGGDIILQKEIDVKTDDDYAALFQRLLKEACMAMGDIIKRIEEGNIVLKKQDSTQVSFAPKIDKKLSHIDWQKKAVDIYNLVRGLRGNGEAWCSFRGRIFRIKRLIPLSEPAEAVPGSIVYVDKKTLKIASQDKNLSLEELKPEGKNFMDVKSFISGYRPQVGERFT